MTHTPTIPEAGDETVQSTILQRVSVPLFSFSAVLFVSLLASQTFLLPKLTTFTVGDLSLSVDEAIAYERTLRADVLSLEDERTELVLPYIDDAHAALMERKRRTPSVLDVRQEVEAAMRAAVEVEDAAVFVDAVLVETEKRAVTVRGRVEDERPGTMAILAAAIEAVRALPDVADLTPPPLTREPVAGIGYRSPFTFTFTFGRSTAESPFVTLSKAERSEAEPKGTFTLRP